jgi:hypothetical protein
MTLTGEEGEFGRSVVMVDQGHLPRGIIARSPYGAEFTIPAGHNLGGYLLPAALLLPALRMVGFSSLEQRRRIATALRVCIAVLYVCALGFALVLLDEGARARGAALLAAFSMPVLPLLGSVQVNYDGAISTGLVLAGLCLARVGMRRGKLRWNVLAGIVLSFGKVEFAIAALMALVLSDLIGARWRSAFATVVGLIAAELVWRGVDPTNFDYGVELVRRYWSMQGGLHSSLAPRAWAYAQTNSLLLWPVYASLAIALVVAIVRRRAAVLLSPVALTLLFIVVGYHAIAWRGDGFPRYFGPCFPLAALLLAELELPFTPSYAVAALVTLLALPSYFQLSRDHGHALARVIHSNRDDLQMARELEGDPRGCVVNTDMDSGIGFYSGRVSFACCGAQWGDWISMHGGSLCQR